MDEPLGGSATKGYGSSAQQVPPAADPGKISDPIGILVTFVAPLPLVVVVVPPAHVGVAPAAGAADGVVVSKPSANEHESRPRRQRMAGMLVALLAPNSSFTETSRSLGDCWVTPKRRCRAPAQTPRPCTGARVHPRSRRVVILFTRHSPCPGAVHEQTTRIFTSGQQWPLSPAK